jgi:hypothetical protein
MSAPVLRNPLSISGGPLAPLVSRVKAELHARRVPLVPHFCLSDEWGVPWADEQDRPFEPPYRSIAIPFYLADADLAAREQIKEEWDIPYTAEEILQLLRHEAGHVVVYAYRLYRRPAWRRLFRDMLLPYPEDNDYPCDTSSRDFVRHLPEPECYAQKHPDEDWAETFAVWLDPASDWRTQYAAWPVALAKLEYCARAVAGLARLPVPVTQTVPTEDETTEVPAGWYD